MTENRKTPKLRFKGFTDAWEQRKLGELALFNPKDELPKIFEYVDLESVVGTEMLSHRTETKSSAPSRAQRVARIGDLFYQTVRPYQKNNYLFEKPYKNYVFSNGYAQMRPFVDGYFMLCLVQSERFIKIVLDNCTGTSYPAINSNNLEEIEVYAPLNKKEGNKIGTMFRSIDNLITLHQRKLDRLKNIKKSMLDKMFPKDGEVVPEIRFKEFTDAWEQRKLSEVLSSYTDPVEIPRTGYERLGIRSHAKGTFHNFVPAGHELQTAQMHRVATDKFIVNITFGWEHAVAVTDENDAGKLVSHRFPQFSLSEELDPKFLKFIILDEDFRHHLWLASPGGAGRNRVLNINEMLQYEIMIPNVPEQRKIARMLIDLDNLITLHQRKSFDILT